MEIPHSNPLWFKRYSNFSLGFLFSTFSFAGIISVPSDYNTIQAAIDAANSGDTILIADGIFSGPSNKNLSWDASQKHLIIKSENGYSNCILDCEYSGRGFNLNQGQNYFDVIDGLTIKNGWAVTINPVLKGGGAILCDSASPEIKNCFFLHNIAGDSINSYTAHSYWSDGGAIDILGSPGIGPNIHNNVFENNFASHTGGALHYWNAGGNLINNYFLSNQNNGCYGGGAIALAYTSNPKIIGNIIARNNATYYYSGGYGGGIICLNSNPIIANNTIFGNGTFNKEYNEYGEGGGIRIRGLPSPKLINNIIWDNHSRVDSLDNLDFQYPQWTLDISYCSLGGGLFAINSYQPSTNYFSNPLLMDTTNNNFQLLAGSPCINAGSSTGISGYLPIKDYLNNQRINNGEIDIGAFEFQLSSSFTNEKFSEITGDFIIYPNPFNDYLNIVFNSENSNFSYNIFNNLWEKVISFCPKMYEEDNFLNFENSPSTKNEKKLTLYLSSIPSGLYFIKAGTEGKTVVKKIFKE